MVFAVNEGLLTQKYVFGGFKRDSSFTCVRRLGTARPLDGRKITEVQMIDKKLEVVNDMRFLGDMISVVGGCELSSITRCESVCRKFRQYCTFLKRGA